MSLLEGPAEPRTGDGIDSGRFYNISTLARSGGLCSFASLCSFLIFICFFCLCFLSLQQLRHRNAVGVLVCEASFLSLNFVVSENDYNR